MLNHLGPSCGLCSATAAGSLPGATQSESAPASSQMLTWLRHSARQVSCCFGVAIVLCLGNTFCDIGLQSTLYLQAQTNHQHLQHRGVDPGQIDHAPVNFWVV